MDFGAAITCLEQTVEGLLAWLQDNPRLARMSQAVSGLAAGPAAD